MGLIGFLIIVGTFSTGKLGLLKDFVSVKGSEFYENRLAIV